MCSLEAFESNTRGGPNCTGFNKEKSNLLPVIARKFMIWKSQVNHINKVFRYIRLGPDQARQYYIDKKVFPRFKPTSSNIFNCHDTVNPKVVLCMDTKWLLAAGCMLQVMNGC